MTQNEYRDLYTRWLMARRDTPSIDVGPAPKYVTRDLNSHRDCEVGKRLRHECEREFNRSETLPKVRRVTDETSEEIIADIVRRLKRSTTAVPHGTK